MKEPADGYPPYRSHLWPRTRLGRIAVLTFLVLFALTQPPVVFIFANRTEPWILGFPFLYAYLFIVYVLLIAVLLWARRKNL